MQVETTRMYRVKEVAEHFAVSVTTIYRAIESGELNAVKLGTRTGTLRVTGAAVAAYAQACTQAATGSTPTAATSSVTAQDAHGGIEEFPQCPVRAVSNTTSVHEVRTAGEILIHVADEMAGHQKILGEGGDSCGSAEEHSVEG